MGFIASAENWISDLIIHKKGIVENLQKNKQHIKLL